MIEVTGAGLETLLHFQPRHATDPPYAPLLSCHHSTASYTWDFIGGTYHNYDEDADNATAVVELAHVPRSLTGKCMPQDTTGEANCHQCPKGASGRKLVGSGGGGECVHLPEQCHFQTFVKQG